MTTHFDVSSSRATKQLEDIFIDTAAYFALADMLALSAAS